MTPDQTERLLEAMRTAAVFLDELDDVRAENVADYLRVEIREARVMIEGDSNER